MLPNVVLCKVRFYTEKKKYMGVPLSSTEASIDPPPPPPATARAPIFSVPFFSPRFRFFSDPSQGEQEPLWRREWKHSNQMNAIQYERGY